MLNSAVSLGRAGVPVHLISDFADDRPGDLIDDFLKLNHIGTQYINRYSAGKTALALAFLDDAKDAAYTFYKDYPVERFPWQLPEPGIGDVILFGSIYSITAGLHDQIIRFISKARKKGAFILYDPNFRKPHLHDAGRMRISTWFSAPETLRKPGSQFQTVIVKTWSIPKIKTMLRPLSTAHIIHFPCLKLSR